MTGSLATRPSGSMLEMFPVCCRYLTANQKKILQSFPPPGSSADIPEFLNSLISTQSFPVFIAELAHLEYLFTTTGRDSTIFPPTIRKLSMNPTMQLARVAFRGLWQPFPPHNRSAQAFSPGEELVAIFRSPKDNAVKMQPATDDILLALKIVTENLDLEMVARDGNISAAALRETLNTVAGLGIIHQPESRLKRDIAVFTPTSFAGEDFLTTKIFTLQWHITQNCDLHCRHCYDRSSMKQVSYAKAITIMDELAAFCLERNVQGQISFSGGNPLLHPRFQDLYRAASERNLILAILGNPTTREQLAQLKAVETPAFYQVSLEGMPEHNDYIRGEGHFDRVVAFLQLLQEMDIYSMVMLTLSAANIDQVIKLAEFLRDKTDLFTFNRLSLVGEGANLSMPATDLFQSFLKQYHTYSQNNPIAGLKDSLFNIIRLQEGLDPFGGCAGFGCGAAFNFISILPDGQVHACRKFPSPIGNLNNQSLAEIYDSAAAARYRNGSIACQGCEIRPVCGGCLAVTHSLGFDIFREKDPCCFLNQG